MYCKVVNPSAHDALGGLAFENRPGFSRF